MKNGREAVIVSAVRTAVGRGKKGTLTHTRPDDLAGIVLKAACQKAGIDPSMVQDVILGCAMPEGEQGLNVARLACFLADFPHTVPAMTVNRFCSSGLQAIALGAQEIWSGMADCVVVGGVESMSMVPMSGNKPSMNMRLVDTRPGAYLGMGLTAENLAEKYKISRQAADEFALGSHHKAAEATAKGKFKDEIVPVEVRVDKRDGVKITSSTTSFATDELVRADTNMESLGALKPSFKLGGSVTPGNSSPLSDGAAALVLMSAAKAKELGLKPLGRFVSFAVAGVPPEIMGIGPVEAVPKALQQADLKASDISLVELNEAFAAQSLAVLHDLSDFPAEKVNPNGGAIALGHPLGCTGAKLTVSAVHELQRRGGGHALVTMCIGGGQGAAGVITVD